MIERAYRNAGGKGDVRAMLEVAPCPIQRITKLYRRLHRDEGLGRVEISAGLPDRLMRNGRNPLPRSDIALAALCGASLARAELRRTAIASATDETDPAWSMTAHPVAAAAMRVHAILLNTVRVGDGERKPGQSENLADKIEGFNHWTARGTIHVVSGHLWISFLEEPSTGMILSQTRGRHTCRITLKGQALPDTTMIAMRGRPLRDALAHGIVDIAGDVVIHRMHAPDAAAAGDLPKIAIDMTASAVSMAPAPAYVDVSWRRLPALHVGDIQ